MTDAHRARRARLTAATTFANPYNREVERHVDWVLRMIEHPDKPKVMIPYGRASRRIARGMAPLDPHLQP